LALPALWRGGHKLHHLVSNVVSKLAERLAMARISVR